MKMNENVVQDPQSVADSLSSELKKNEVKYEGFIPFEPMSGSKSGKEIMNEKISGWNETMRENLCLIGRCGTDLFFVGHGGYYVYRSNSFWLVAQDKDSFQQYINIPGTMNPTLIRSNL